MITARRNKDRTITITLSLFRWHLAIHIRDVEWWRASVR